MTPTRRAALLAGLLYLSTHVTSVAAVAFYGALLTDPSAAMSPDRDPAVLTGAVLEILLALGVLGTGVALLPVLRPHAPIGAYAFSALRTLEAAVIAVGVMPMIALVSLHNGGIPAGADTSVAALVALHQASFLVGQGLIISVTTIVLAGTLWRTRVVPAWIAVLGLVGGGLILLSNSAQVAGALDRGGSFAAVAAVPAFAFEIAFAVYLILVGVREEPQAPTATATDRRSPGSRKGSRPYATPGL